MSSDDTVHVWQLKVLLGLQMMNELCCSTCHVEKDEEALPGSEGSGGSRLCVTHK